MTHPWYINEKKAMTTNIGEFFISNLINIIVDYALFAPPRDMSPLTLGKLIDKQALLYYNSLTEFLVRGFDSHAKVAMNRKVSGRDVGKFGFTYYNGHANGCGPIFIIVWVHPNRNTFGVIFPTIKISNEQKTMTIGDRHHVGVWRDYTSNNDNNVYPVYLMATEKAFPRQIYGFPEIYLFIRNDPNALLLIDIKKKYNRDWNMWEDAPPAFILFKEDYMFLDEKYNVT
jgi:hypothetical protein